MEGPKEKASNPANGRTGQAYILFALSLVFVVILGSTVQFWSVLFGLGFTELVLILLPAILFVRRKRLPVFEALRWKPVPATTAILSVAVGITGWGIAAGIFVLSENVLGEGPVTQALIPQTVPDLLWILFFAALLPGFCEESLFRGAIQGILRRNGKARAVVITALLFAVFHVSPWSFVPALFLGIVFGVLVVRTGSTVPAILAHIANNATAFTVSYLYHDQPETRTYLLMAGLAAASCIFLPLFLFLTSAKYDVPPVLAAVPAAVERKGAWLLGLIGGSVLAVIAAGVVAILLSVDLRSVPDDALAPDVRRGDQLIIFKATFVELDLEEGDVIIYRRDGETVLRKIERLDAENAWIREDGSEKRLTRAEILGKVVQIIKASELTNSVE
ncbi:MAG: CPBP family intramembrane metalloprotease [Acidobacteriota bacterium]|nr:CPBP family intramembrane metalloprotease [Acidobacteriota bacterium]MDH3528765.1 CPBP family intramembrane metalloprotease [Acidobacteriota bacterium]